VTDPSGAKVLIVDDDIRNIFALTSVPSVRRWMLFTPRTKGRYRYAYQDTRDRWRLMDIACPKWTALKPCAIRQIHKFRSAAGRCGTAKAMTGDRQRCIKPGV
jgi:hypothetical protein